MDDQLLGLGRVAVTPLLARGGVSPRQREYAQAGRRVQQGGPARRRRQGFAGRGGAPALRRARRSPDPLPKERPGAVFTAAAFESSAGWEAGVRAAYPDWNG